MSSRRLLAAALAVPLLAAGARGQGGELGPDAGEEEKLRVCPALRDAEGRRREQLEALYFELDPADLDAEDAAAARALFDLAVDADAAVLAAELDGPGPARCLPGLQAVLRAHGPRGLTWLLERLAATPAARRGRAVACLAAFDEREAWRVLLALLADPTPVPNPGGAAVAPPGYQDLRVCDHALRALGPRLRRVVPPPEGQEWRAEPLLPLAVRDKRVAAARAAAAGPALTEHLAARPSAREALAPDAAAQARLDAALEVLGVQ